MTALFGWMVAWLFVKALFINWEGGLSQYISTLKIEQLITPEVSLKQFDLLLPTLDKHLDDFFNNKLTQKMPMIAMFIGNKTIEQLKEVFIEELKLMFPELVQKLLNGSIKEFESALQQKWKKSLEISLLKATRKIRIAAFILGFLWGILLLLLNNAI
jgi:hypothetical protein